MSGHHVSPQPSGCFEIQRLFPISMRSGSFKWNNSVSLWTVNPSAQKGSLEEDTIKNLYGLEWRTSSQALISGPRSNLSSEELLMA